MGVAAADKSLVVRFPTEILPFDLLDDDDRTWTFSDSAVTTSTPGLVRPRVQSSASALVAAPRRSCALLDVRREV